MNAFSTIALPLTQVRSTKSKAERNALVEDIKNALSGQGLSFEIDDDRLDVSIRALGPDLNADVWIGIDEQPTDVPIISWFKASQPLAPVKGAWREEDINPVHGRKATSHPSSFEELIRMLQAGFAASSNRSAFAA